MKKVVTPLKRLVTGIKIMDDLIKKIKEDIKKTGFVSELNTISKLLKMGWDAEHSLIYEDKDEKKSREIDIIGSNLYKNEKINFDLDIVLIIEVKKTSKPWIIFTSEFDKKYWRPEIVKSGFNIHKWVDINWEQGGSSFSEPSSRLEPCDIFNYEPLSILTHPDGYNRIGKAFHEFSKKGNEPSQIYSSLMGLSKAVVFFDELNYPDKTVDMDFNPEFKKTLSIYLPIVVLDGNLFEVYNDKEGELNVISKNVISVDSTIISENYSSPRNGFRLTHTIVAIDDFENYLGELDKRLTLLCKKFCEQLENHMNNQ